MKDIKREGAHKRGCWFRDDDTDPKGWFFNTYNGVFHDEVRGHRYVYMSCNCPGCPAALRVRLSVLEDYVVGLLS